MKILIAPDSFKDCLSSSEVASAIAEGIQTAMPDAEIITLPLADGGDGTVDVLEHYLGGVRICCTVHDPLMRPIKASYLLTEGSKTAIIGLAEASGIELLTQNERNVMQTTSYGFGELIADAIRHGVVKIICALGGSATNDCGLGALQALGLKIYGNAHKIFPIVRGCDLIQIKEIDNSLLRSQTKDLQVTFLYDADIAFTGPQGAVALYAAQKGATVEDKECLEKGMKNIASIIGYKEHDIPGAGAAGGTGFGFATLLMAKGWSGAEYILDISGFRGLLKNSDFVITGEGKIDSQTLQGKTVAAVLKDAIARNIPLAVVAGKVREKELLLNSGLRHLICINDGYDSSGHDCLKPENAKARLNRAGYQSAQLVI